MKRPKVSQELPSQTNSSGQRTEEIMFSSSLPTPVAIWVAQLDWFIIVLLCISSDRFHKLFFKTLVSKVHHMCFWCGPKSGFG